MKTHKVETIDRMTTKPYINRLNSVEAEVVSIQ